LGEYPEKVEKTVSVLGFFFFQLFLSSWKMTPVPSMPTPVETQGVSGSSNSQPVKRTQSGQKFVTSLYTPMRSQSFSNNNFNQQLTQLPEDDVRFP
jgi:hypothetical protein